MALGRSSRLATLVALVILPAAAQTAATAYARDELRVVDKECRDVSPPQAKIRECLGLLGDRRISIASIAPINGEISSAFESLRDYDNAIKYKKIEIERALAPVKQISADEAPPVTFGAMSQRYTELGTLQSLNRLTNLKSLPDDARRSAADEQNNYNLALQYNPMNYRAYRRRADIHSVLCNSASATQDLEAAIKFAELAGDQNAARDYKRVTLSACIPAWRRD